MVDIEDDEADMENDAGLIELMAVEVEERVSAWVMSCLSFA